MDKGELLNIIQTLIEYMQNFIKDYNYIYKLSLRHSINILILALYCELEGKDK